MRYEGDTNIFFEMLQNSDCGKIHKKYTTYSIYTADC